MRREKCPIGFREWSLAIVAIGLVWLCSVHAQPSELLTIVEYPDATTEQAAQKAVGAFHSYEGFVRWGIVRADIRTILIYDESIAQSAGIDAFTLSPFPDYRFHASRTAFNTDFHGDGYPAVWEGELDSSQWLGGGQIFVYVNRYCESGQPHCLMIHAYPHSGIVDKFLYERVIGLWETEIPGVYVVVETKRGNTETTRRMLSWIEFVAMSASGR